jgi:hypothetical protein
MQITRARAAQVASPRLDVGDAMIDRYIDRVCTLTPAEWDRLATRATVPAPVSPGWSVTLARHAMADGLETLADLLLRAEQAPLWRWWGSGPYRRLGEALDRPYARAAQSRVLLGLSALKDRRREDPDVIRTLYAGVEPVIAWASLGGDPQPWGA